MKRAVSVLIISALCAASGAEVVSKTYVVIPSQSSVLKRNWSWGYTEEYYGLSGQFYFTYDIPSDAEFNWVDVELDKEIAYLDFDGIRITNSLDVMFHMTELQFVDANSTEIHFVYEKNNPTFPSSDVNFTVSFQGDNLLLTGRFSDEIYDGWQYDVNAVAMPMRYSGGTGEPNDPYRIATPEDLNSIGLDPCDWDKHFLMTADINMADITGDQFNMIGYGSDYSDPNKKPFSGTFDGGGHTIYNLTYKAQTGKHVGLFSRIEGQNAEVRRINLIRPSIQNQHEWCPPVGSIVGSIFNGIINGCTVYDANICGQSSVGILAGTNAGTIEYCELSGTARGEADVGGVTGDNSGSIIGCSMSVIIECEMGAAGGISGENIYGTIEGCCSQGAVTITGWEGPSWDAGGLVGWNLNGVISNCSADVNVTGSGYVGGAVGESYGGSIHSSYARGIVSGNYNVGGFVGQNVNGSKIEECFFEGSVTGADSVGGFAGFSSSPILNCYCKAEVSGNQSVGGFIGYSLMNSQKLVNCFSACFVDGNDNVGAFIGRDCGCSECFWDTTFNPDMIGHVVCSDSNAIGLPTAQMQMRSTFSDAGWDMVNAWDIGENQTYPFLRMHLPSDINKDGQTNLYDFAIIALNWLEE